MIVSAVYEIICTQTSQRYIGQSTDVHRRLQAHRRRLLSGKHKNRRMQACWNTFGERAFQFNVIIEAAPENLTFWEDRWVTSHDTRNPSRGFNVRTPRDSTYQASQDPSQLVAINWRIPRELLQRLKMAAALESMTSERLAASVLSKYLSRRGLTSKPMDKPAA